MRSTIVSTMFSLMLCSSFSVAQDKPNPDFVYFSGGDTPDYWTWVLSDTENWWMQIDGNEGVSAKKKVTMTSDTFKNKNDAVKIVWSKKKGWGGVSIAGRNIDLSKYEQLAELSLALKVEKRPKGDVKIKLSCGDKCEAEVPITHMIKKAPLKQWFALPIPLDCFVKAGADLSKISTPFSMGTEGQMVLSVAEVKIQPMVAGDKGCIE